MPKAASTTLQKQLFPALENCQNFGLFPTNNIGIDQPDCTESSIYSQDRRMADFYKCLHNEIKIDLTEMAEHWRLIHQSNADKKYSQVLLSHEAITAPFFSSNNQEEKLRRIKELFPDAKIILVLRNQIDWFRSQYRDHPFEPTRLASGKSIDFDSWVHEIITSDQLEGVRNALDYSKLITAYQKAFGTNSICVLLCEDLALNPYKFSKEIAEFLGERVEHVAEQLRGRRENVGVSGIYNRLRQFQRNFPESFITRNFIEMATRSSFLKKLPQKNYGIKPKTKRLVSEFYGDSNNQLWSRMGICVDEYEYPGVAIR